VATPAAATTLISYCGQSFRGRGVLTGNLDCTGFGASAVTIEGGRLRMNGFTITGGDVYTVHCTGPCQIDGPGTIQGATWDGIRADTWLIANELNVRNNGLNGILVVSEKDAGRLILRDVSVTGNGLSGVQVDAAAFIRRTTISGNAEHGIDIGVQNCASVGRLQTFRTTISGNGVGCPDSQVCADISLCGHKNRAPMLRRSTCGSSYLRGSGIPGIDFGVCLQD
jgi:hypothetical protein